MSSAAASQDGVIRGPKRDFRLPQEGLGRALLRKMNGLGDSTAQVYPELGHVTVSYRQLAQRSASVALELKERNLRPGDVLVVATSIVPQFTPIMVGALLRGVILAPFNPGFDANDLRRVVTETLQPRLVVAERGAASRIRSACPEAEVVDLDDVDSWLGRRDVPLDAAGGVDLQQVAAEEPPGWQDHTAIIAFSSGTTGLPKGVMISNRMFLLQLVTAAETDMKMEGDITALQYTALFWVSGLFMQLFSMFCGWRLVVLPGFEEGTMARAVQQYKVAFMMLSPNCAVALCKAPSSVAPRDLSSLRLVIVGGACMDAPMQRMVEKALSLRLIQIYGMTEYIFVMCSARGHLAPSGSVGTVRSNIEAKVVDPETGRPLGPDSEGELWIRSPMVTRGYYRRPEATAEALDADGWFHSGDIAYYDQNGFFFITDRLKELIKYRGHHVSPSELEGILVTHLAVKEVGVVGVPHALDQEHPRAYVVLQPGAQVSEEDLLQMVRDEAADFKQLRGGVRFVDSLPKTATGKVSRRELRTLAKKETPAIG